MLDVHIIVSPHTRDEWVGSCLQSVQDARTVAGFPVQVHIAPYLPGHIGISRMAGYAQGDNDYVTCVDDDDWVELNAFKCLFDAMQDNPAAIYTREWQWQNGRCTEGNLRQHLRVFRRDVVESFDFENWPALDSTALIAHADKIGPFIQLPDRVYNYRVRPESNAKKIAYNTPNLLESALAFGNVHELAQ